MRTEKKIAGVCAWLADRFDIDVSGLRLIFVVATIIGVGSPILIYLILWLIKPSHY
jgi:phage shock protein C